MHSAPTRDGAGSAVRLRTDPAPPLRRDRRRPTPSPRVRRRRVPTGVPAAPATRVAGGQRLHETFEVGVGALGGADPRTEVTAGQGCAFRPRAGGGAQRRLQQVRRFFGQLAKCGELAAPDGQQWRLRGVQLEKIVPRHGRGVARAIVEQRAHARERPHHIGRHDGALEIAARLLAEIADLAIVDAHFVDGPSVLDVGGADEREVALVGNRKDDAPVGVLEDVGVVVVEHLGHDDMTALHQPQRLALRHMRVLGQELCGPGAGGIHQRPRVQRMRHAASVAQRRPPLARLASGIDARPARQHGGAAAGGVDGVEHHQAGVVDPAVGIDEALREALLQRRADGMATQIDRRRTRQHFTPRQVIVEEEAGTDHPGRPHGRVVRHHEAQRPHDVRCAPKQQFALEQRLAHHAELVVLEVAQAAVDQLGGGRGGVRRKVVLLAQHHAQATAGQVTGDPGAVDATANDEHVACRRQRAGCRRWRGRRS